MAKLTNRVASTAHVEFHARIISEKFILRSLIDVSAEVIKSSYDETKDVFEGWISNKRAYDVYGVKVNSRGQVNKKATLKKAS